MTVNLSRPTSIPARNQHPDTTTTPLLDQKTLEMYRQITYKKKKNVVKLIFGNYLRYSRDGLAELIQSINAADEKKIEILAHTLKSTSAQVGAFSLANLFSIIEASAYHHRLYEIDDTLLEKVTVLHRDVHEAIKGILTEEEQ